MLTKPKEFYKEQLQKIQNFDAKELVKYEAMLGMALLGSELVSKLHKAIDERYDELAAEMSSGCLVEQSVISSVD